MKVTIINGFETYEERVELVKNFFESKGSKVKILQSDFLHMKKEYISGALQTGKKYIHVKSYTKNLTISRLISHYLFAKDSLKEVENWQPEIIYILVPPNSLVYHASKYKKRNPNVLLVFDIMDVWPETMPINNKVKKKLFLWKNLRDNYLDDSDIVISECQLFQEILLKRQISSQVVYLAKKEINISSVPKLSTNQFDICYLGSINNIIDISTIIDTLLNLRKIKSVSVHIIGDGERREEFVNELKKNNIDVFYYGKIYDYRKKQQIIDKCHFGLNIMKNTVSIGLTMKSIDYYQHGIPIINNIPHDTHNLVDSSKSGFNISSIDWTQFDFSIENNLIMRQNSLFVFDKYFSQKQFNETMSKIFLEHI